MSGFFVMHRGWRDNPVFRGEFSRGDAWVWLIENACWKPTKFDVKGKTITLERGQLCASRDYLAKVWGWSSSAVERFLARLQTEQMIGRETGQGKSIVTISNYAKYQDVGSQTGQETGQQSGQRSDRDRTAKEQGNKETREEEPSGSPSPDVAEAKPDLGEFEPAPVQPFTPEDLGRLWNRAAQEMGLPKVREMTEARRKRALTMIRKYGREGFVEAISAIERSTFLRGQTEQQFKADLDFVLQQKSFTRLIEGFYDRSSRANSRSRYEPDGAMAYLQRSLGIEGGHEPSGSPGRWNDGKPERGHLLPDSRS